MIYKILSRLHWSLVGVLVSLAIFYIFLITEIIVFPLSIYGIVLSIVMCLLALSTGWNYLAKFSLKSNLKDKLFYTAKRTMVITHCIFAFLILIQFVGHFYFMYFMSSVPSSDFVNLMMTALILNSISIYFILLILSAIYYKNMTRKRDFIGCYCKDLKI